MKKIKLMVFKALFIILSLFVVSQQAFAMKCVKGPVSEVPFDVGSVSQRNDSYTSNPLKIIATNKKDVIVWQADYSTTLTCYDDTARNVGENVKIYPDDNAKRIAMEFSDKDISVGIIYNGIEHLIDESAVPIDTGEAGIIKVGSKELSTKGKYNCELMKFTGTNNCATANTVTINYSLFLKSKSSGNHITGNAEYKVFQMDGVGGLNSGGNFSEWIVLGRVEYIDCVPQPTSTIVDLGGYPNSSPLNTILGKKLFTINVETIGEQCADAQFRAEILPSSSLIDNETLKTDLEGVGIQIFDVSDNKPLKFDSNNGGINVDFGYATGNHITKSFDASVIFKSKPKAGQFTGTLNYQLWIK